MRRTIFLLMMLNDQRYPETKGEIPITMALREMVSIMRCSSTGMQARTDLLRVTNGSGETSPVLNTCSLGKISRSRCRGSKNLPPNQTVLYSSSSANHRGQDTTGEMYNVYASSVIILMWIFTQRRLLTLTSELDTPV